MKQRVVQETNPDLTDSWVRKAFEPSTLNWQQRSHMNIELLAMLGHRLAQRYQERMHKVGREKVVAQLRKQGFSLQYIDTLLSVNLG